MSGYPAPGIYPALGTYPSHYGSSGGPLTLTATPEPDATPPRIRLDINDTRNTPITQVTITRQGADGQRAPVRTVDGGPQPISGGVGTLYDFEPPYGTTVTYSTDVDGLGPATAQLDVDRAWLIDPAVPSRSTPIELRAGSNATEDWDIDQGVFPILGERYPIVVTGGARQAPTSSLLIGLESDLEREALKLLLQTGGTLLLLVPPTLNVGLDSVYISVGKVSLARPTGVGTDQLRDVQLPYQVVARPYGGTVAGRTWADVAAQYPTWQAIIDAGIRTWAELAAPQP